MNRTIILTAVLTAVLTAALTTAGILGSALYIKDHQTRQAQSEQPAEAKPAAEEQPVTPPAEQIAEKIAEHLAKSAEPSVAEAPDPAQTVTLPISREAFEKLVINKTVSQVARMIGAPNFFLPDRLEQNPLLPKYVAGYPNAIVDQSDGSTHHAYIHFTSGIVDKIMDWDTTMTQAPEQARPAERPSPTEAKADPAYHKEFPIPGWGFETLVIGKTKDQVLEMIGKPDSISSRTDQWFYQGMVIDQTTRNALRACINFKDGIADHVTYK